jgi:hypothetical protein
MVAGGRAIDWRESMSGTINVFIDKSEAIKAGRSRWGEVAIPVTDEQLAALSQWERDVLARSQERGASWNEKLSGMVAPTWEEVTAAVRRIVERVETERKAAVERVEEAVQEFLNKPTSDMLYCSHDRHVIMFPGYEMSDAIRADPRCAAKLSELAQAIREADEEVQAERKREEADREAANSRKKAAADLEAQMVSTAVSFGATENQKARWVAGVLPTGELYDVLRDYWLPVPDGIGPEKIYQPADLPDASPEMRCGDSGEVGGRSSQEDDHPGLVVMETDEIEEMDAAEWDRFQAIKDAMREDVGVLNVRAVEQTLECSADLCHARMRVRRVIAELTLPGGRQLRRRFAL